MKKIISGILAILMVASIAFGAFAAPSVSKVVGVSATNGDYIFYIFGENASENASEVGLTIEGRTEDYKLRYFPKDEEDSLQKYLECGKYGIGINDSKNLLGNSFKAAPYEIVNGEKIVGDYVTINKSEVETADYVGLTKLFINGKAAPGFHTETPETDFYYGLETLPATAEELPVIEIASNYGTLVKGEVEKYYGGYTVPYSVEYTNVNGNVLDKTFKIHFREFSDKVVTELPVSAYRVHHSYLDYSKEDMMNLQAETEKDFNISLNTDSDIPSNKDTYIYMSYNVDEIEGYAPVSYDLTGLAVKYNPFDIYSYDGDLSNVTLPRTSKDALENAGMFSGFKGYNPVPEFHLYGNGGTPDASNFMVKEAGVVATTTSVTEGNNILIYRSRLPIINQYHAYLVYGSSPASSYKMKINVKYVEKNPVDITMYDATVKSVSYDGIKAAGYDEETSTYYIGVESFDKFDFASASVKVDTNVEGAAVVYGTYDKKLNQLPVTVIAKDGVTENEYTIIFKEIAYKNFAFTSNYGYRLEYVANSGKYQTGSRDFVTSGTTSYTPADGLISSIPDARSYTSYFIIPTKEMNLGKFALAGMSKLNVAPSRYDTYVFFDSEYDSIKSDCRYTEIIEGTATILGSYICSNSSTTELTVNVDNKIEIDNSLLTIKENGNIVIGVYDGDSSNTTTGVLKNCNIDLAYIVMEPNADPDLTDTTIASLKVNGLEADAYDESTSTYYKGVETLVGLDYESVTVDAETSVSDATVEYGEFDNVLKTLPIIVTAKDGVTKKAYTLIFKKYENVELTPEGYAYQYQGGVGGQTTMNAQSTQSPLVSSTASIDYVGYAQFDVKSLVNIAICGESVLSGKVGSQGTYDFYNSIYDTYKVNDGFKEFNEGKASLVGTIEVDSTSYNVEKSLSFDGNALRITSEGKIVLALVERFDDVNNKVFYKDVKLALSYIALKPNTAADVEEPEVKDPADTDVSIKSVMINNEEALYYDAETKTFYTAVESLENYDFDNCDITVVTNVEGADGFGFADSESKQGLIEVTSKDGSVTEEYTLVFKEIQHTKINWTALPYLHYENSKYSSGNYNANKNMIGRRPADEMETHKTTVTYAEFPTTQLGNIILAGKSYFTAVPSYNTTHLLYNTTYDKITKNNTFDEIKNGKADLLATLVCSSSSNPAKNPYTIEIDSSLLRINSEGNIYIGLAGANTTNAIFKDISADEPMNLNLGYITID